jgi:hypothetical protein
MFKMLHSVSNGMRAKMYTFLGRDKESSSPLSSALEFIERRIRWVPVDLLPGGKETVARVLPLTYRVRRCYKEGSHIASVPRVPSGNDQGQLYHHIHTQTHTHTHTYLFAYIKKKKVYEERGVRKILGYNSS